VKDLLANRVYLGEARAGQRVLENAHEALIDEGLFAAAAGQVPGHDVSGASHSLPIRRPSSPDLCAAGPAAP
jgi:hypothetical protein